MLQNNPAVVITGASSGLGRATAHAFARRGAKLVLAARDGAALANAAEECAALGGEARIHIVDVTDAAAVEKLAADAVQAFGRIDVWVNCAIHLIFGPLTDIPPEAFRRVIEVNVLGYFHGCRAAVRQFRAQGDRGVLIDVGSVLSLVGEPYASGYVTSKFAIRGLSACLRQEVRDRSDIHICTILPAAMDTPIYQHAANYQGRRARSIWPISDPDVIAEAIVGLADRPRRELIIGNIGWLVAMGAWLAPGLLERLVGRFAPALQFEDQAEETGGNLFTAGKSPQAAHGGWREYWRGKSLRKALFDGSREPG